MKALSRLSILIFGCFSTQFSLGQSPDIEWETNLGGSNTDYGQHVQQTSDGGYIVVSSTGSNNGDVSGNNGGGDIWVVKLDATGDVQWQKCFGGSDEEEAAYIQQTNDNGYILIGYTMSNDGDVSGHHGGRDFWVVKISPAGSIQWQKSLGGTSHDTGAGVTQTADGGFIVTGWTFSTDGNVLNNPEGGMDMWVVKLSILGAIEWQQCYGGDGADQGTSIKQTDDNGYIVCGFTQSNNIDVVGYNGGGDAWVLKLSPAGLIQWQNSLGGTLEEMGSSIEQTADGGYILCGYANSNDGDVVGHNGAIDAWVVKLDPFGNIEWQNSLGGTADDSGHMVIQTTDLGYLMTGWTNSTDGDATDVQGLKDGWAVKLDPSGNLEWQKTMGGGNLDALFAVDQNFDGDYVFAGHSHSDNGDVSENNGASDVWVVKIGCFNTTSISSVVACLPLTINDELLFISGTYVQTIANAAGCDSTITLLLTIDPFATYGALEVLVLADGLPVENMAVEVSSVQGGQYPAQELVTDVNGIALFENLPYGDYVCLTNPNPAIAGQDLMLPTFSNETSVWYEAEHLDIGCGLTKPTNIDNVILPPRPTGPGSVSGQVFGGGVNRTGDPIPGIPIKISTDTISENAYPPPGDGIYVLFDYAVTDENGHYEFPELPYGHFKVDVIVPGLYTLPDPSQTAISDSTAHFFTVQLGSIEYTENSFWVDPELGVFLDPDAPDCSGDINQDGITGFADLVVLLADYGCNSGDCTADLNDDGLVNFNDLTIMLGNYGTECP